MPIIAREPKVTRTPAPEGLHPGICIDVVDLGLVEDEFGSKYKVELRWALEEENLETGKRFIVTRRFTNSLHKKAGLRQALEMWRNKPFTAEELAGFDLERLLGASCQIQIVHRPTNNGDVFANVQAVIPLGKGMPKVAPLVDYVRVKDRDQRVGASDANGQEAEDDGVPF